MSGWTYTTSQGSQERTGDGDAGLPSPVSRLPSPVLFMFLCLAMPISLAYGGPLDMIKMRIYQDLASRAPKPEADIRAFMDTLSPNGSWPDVDYMDGQLGDDAAHHLRRVVEMAVACRKEGYPLYGSEALEDKVIRAVTFWVDEDVQASNIFYHGHEYQNRLGDALILMQPRLSPELLRKAKPLMDRAWNTRGHWTAHNLVWRCEATMKRCVLYDEGDLLDEVIQRLKNEQMKITTEEGIQCDFSFHQHKSQLYNGGYGLGFQRDMPWWIELMQGTPYAFSGEDIQLIASLVLEGTQWMTRGRLLDYACQGRNNAGIPRSHTRAEAMRTVCERMVAIDPERASKYQFYIDCIEGRETLSGNRVFWRSDFMVHHRKKYFTSVKMHSVRTVGFEIVPESPQGRRNFHRSDGVTYIIRDGSEYAGNLFPAWNWRRLPGTTAEQVDGPFPWAERYQVIFGTTAFAGAASDGTYGAAGYDFLKTAGIAPDDPNTVTAKKAYFCFDDEFVCLGAGITGYRDYPVCTTMNQCRLNRGITVGYADEKRETVEKEAEEVLDAPRYVLHNGVGYVFPEPVPICMSAKQQSGRMVDLWDFGSPEPLYEDVFCLWQDHGIRPSGASYQYIVVPGVEENELARYADRPGVRVLRNTTSAQAVRHDGLGVSGIVFYQAGRVQVTPDVAVAVDKPCIVLIREVDGKLRVALSNPACTALEVKLQVNGKDTLFSIPEGQYAGRSIIKTI